MDTRSERAKEELLEELMMLRLNKQLLEACESQHELEAEQLKEKNAALEEALVHRRVGLITDELKNAVSDAARLKIKQLEDRNAFLEDSLAQMERAYAHKMEQLDMLTKQLEHLPSQLLQASDAVQAVLGTSEKPRRPALPAISRPHKEPAALAPAVPSLTPPTSLPPLDRRYLNRDQQSSLVNGPYGMFSQTAPSDQRAVERARRRDRSNAPVLFSF